MLIKMAAFYFRKQKINIDVFSCKFKNNFLADDLLKSDTKTAS